MDSEFTEADFEYENQEMTRAVAYGARILDDQHPDGWAWRIDKPSLKMEHTEHCILAQLQGTFQKGLNHYHLQKANDCVECGFSLISGDEVLWDMLTKLWIKEIDARL